MRFRPLKLLASGGFGSVWTATQVALGRTVAVKVLHASALADPQQRIRFQNEAKITASIAHPNIVVLIDHGIDDGVPWIAYELVNGESLRKRLDKGPLPWMEAFQIGIQVASALEAAHLHGVIHRDVKPDNVLSTGSGTYKVADFGIARWDTMARLTQTGVIMGTPAYLSPTQIRGEVPAPESDLYALGTMIYELIAGRPPFDHEDGIKILELHLKGKVPSLSHFVEGVPADAEAVVQKALSKKREDRYQSAAAMQEALETVLDAPGRESSKPGPQSGPPSLAAPNDGRTWGAATRAVRPSSAAATLLSGVPSNRALPRWFGPAVASLALFIGLAWVNRPGPSQVPAAVIHRGSPGSTAGPSPVPLGRIRDHRAGSGAFVEPSIQGLAVSPDGRWLATWGLERSQVSVWETSSGARIRSLPPTASLISDLVFSGDGQDLLMGDDQGTIRHWAKWNRQGPPSLTVIHQLGPEVPSENRRTACAWTAAGPIAGISTGNTLRVVGPGFSRTIPIPIRGAGSDRFVVDGATQQVVWVDPASQLRRWNFGRWVEEPMAPRRSKPDQSWDYHGRTNRLVHVVSGPAENERVLVCDASTGALIREWTRSVGLIEITRSLKWLGDGQWVLSKLAQQGASHVLEWRAVDPSTPPVRTSAADGFFHLEAATGTGEVVYTGGHRTRVTGWRRGDRGWTEDQSAWTGHTQRVTVMAMTPDGHTLASGGNDRRVWLWDPATARQRRGAVGLGQLPARIYAGPVPGQFLVDQVSGSTVVLNPVEKSRAVTRLVKRVRRTLGHAAGVEGQQRIPVVDDSGHIALLGPDVTTPAARTVWETAPASTGASPPCAKPPTWEVAAGEPGGRAWIAVQGCGDHTRRPFGYITTEETLNRPSWQRCLLRSTADSGLKPEWIELDGWRRGNWVGVACRGTSEALGLRFSIEDPWWPDTLNGHLKLHRWSLAGSRHSEVTELPDAPEPVSAVELSRRGRWICGGGQRGHVMVLDLETRPLTWRRVGQLENQVVSVTIDDAGKLLAAGTVTGEVHTFEVPALP